MSNIETKFKVTANFSFGLIIVLGILMLFSMVISEYGAPWKLESTKFIGHYAQHPSQPIIAVILFMLGIAISIYLGQVFLILLLIPLALAATLPLTNRSTNLIPPNAVVAFASEGCPSGWTSFEKLNGRVVVGSNPREYLDDNTGHLISERIFGTAHGTETHTLKEEEIPNHHHRNERYNRLVAADGRKTTSTKKDNAPPRTEINIGESQLTKPFGGSGAHNNMQPFFVLTYCRKLEPGEKNPD